MPIVSRNMILDQVNPADETVGHIRRRNVFAEHAGFRVAHILIFDTSCEFPAPPAPRTEARQKSRRLGFLIGGLSVCL